MSSLSKIILTSPALLAAALYAVAVLFSAQQVRAIAETDPVLTTTMTVVAQVYSVSTVPSDTESEFHLWDVATDHFHSLFIPMFSRANNIFLQGQRDAADVESYITSNVIEYGQQAKEKADDMGINAKNKIHDLGQQAKDGFDKMGQEIKGDVNRAEAAVETNAQSLKGEAQKKADKLGHRIKADVDRVKEKAQGDVHYATKRLKNAGEDFYDKMYSEGGKVASEAKDAAQQANRKSQEVVGGTNSYIHSKMSKLLSSVCGSGAQLRSELGASMNKLRDLLSLGFENATPTWPEKVLDANRDPIVADYVHKLNQAAQQANSQVASKLDIHTDILEKIATTHMSSQLPIAGCYVPFVVAAMIYFVSKIWCYKKQLGRMVLQTASAAGSSAETTLAFQQEYIRTSDVITTSCTYLVIVPLATIMLVIMELNGMGNRLIAISYTLLLAGSVPATQMSTLADFTPRVAGSVVAAGQSTMLVITTIIAVCCFVNSVFY
ncbi:hypothetical protein FB645_003036 [Coemansia sp. IMI 203386]|nr:hypothetical protein FB645_003036 [Coemansia sp. IMI 203386]